MYTHWHTYPYKSGALIGSQEGPKQHSGPSSLLRTAQLTAFLASREDWKTGSSLRERSWAPCSGRHHAGALCGEPRLQLHCASRAGCVGGARGTPSEGKRWPWWLGGGESYEDREEGMFGGTLPWSFACPSKGRGSPASRPTVQQPTGRRRLGKRSGAGSAGRSVGGRPVLPVTSKKTGSHGGLRSRGLAQSDFHYKRISQATY